MSEPDDKAAPFETLLDDLEGVVGTLEQGELSLDDSLSAYEKGVALVRAARARLDGMDKRLQKLTEEGRLQPLELDDGEDD